MFLMLPDLAFTIDTSSSCLQETAISEENQETGET